MTAERCLLELLEKGIQLSADGEGLRFKAPGVLTPDLRRRLSDHKVELLRLLDDRWYAVTSFDQQRLWAIEQWHPGEAAYSTGGAFRIRGALDIAALDESLRQIWRRHESLRTTFCTVDGRPVQVIARASRPDAELPLPVVDLEGLCATSRQTQAEALIAAENRRPFHLTQGPLFRVLWVRFAADDWLLLLRVHHAVSDGWSDTVLYQELADLYGSLSGRRPVPLPDLVLPDLAMQYADFAGWQRRRLGGRVAALLEYWRETLDGFESLRLPADRSRSKRDSFRGVSHRLSVAPDQVAALERLGRKAGASLYMVLTAVFMALLFRLTGQQNFVVGAPVTGRQQRELENLIGLFVNMLALRADVAGELRFTDSLHKVRETILGAFDHQELPFDRLVAELAPDREAMQHPLFQVSLALHSAPRSKLGLPGLAVSSVELASTTVHLDFELHLWRAEAGLEGNWVYSSDLFCASTIARWSGHLVALLAEVARDPASRLRDLPLNSPAQRHQLLTEWNDTQRSVSWDGGLHRLFECQALGTPDRVALIWQEMDGHTALLTYRLLNRRADHLARYLRDLGVGPDQRVGIFFDRGPERVLAMLAVLKAGGAYLPLAPDAPRQRLAFQLEDARPIAVLTSIALRPGLPEGLRTICLKAEEHVPIGESPKTEDAERPVPSIRAGNAAYLLYTSGSTGRPKGTEISHAAICHHMLWMQAALPLDGRDRVLQKTPFGFDASVWEFWAPLQVGATLVLTPPGSHRDPAILIDWVRRHRTTILQVVPSLLRVLLQDPRWQSCATLRRVVCGGEVLSPDLRAEFSAASARSELVNAYGPTEGTIHATIQVCDAEPVAIGRPITNVRTVVVDRWLRPVAPGIAGELVIAGVSLARGYSGRPRLTGERFCPNPFVTPLHSAGERLYRTGDLVRHLADGRLTFLGRIDHQLKIRGHRVEPGEIEAQLRCHPSIRDALVLSVPGPGDDDRLVACVAIDVDRSEGDRSGLSSGSVRNFLSARLPESMLPSAIVPFEALPLSSGGKVDRIALARHARVALEQQAATVYEAPRNPMEELIADSWARLLGRQRVGVRDNFFELGGHSLLAIQALSRIRRGLGVRIAVRSLFDRPTVAGLAAEVTRARRGGSRDEEGPVRLKGPLTERPLSFPQQRLWFLDQLEPSSTAYHVLIGVELTGKLQASALEVSLRELIRRHQVLRTVFNVSQGRPSQQIRDVPETVLTRIDLDHLGLSHLGAGERRQVAMGLLAREAREPFDLSRGPMFRVRLLRLGRSQHILLLIVHHIVFDGWSQGILFRELSALYERAIGGGPAHLPEPIVQYADFAIWQRQRLVDAALERRLDFWRSRLDGVPTLRLPVDRPRPKVASGRGATHELEIEPAFEASLRRLGVDHGASLYMVGMTAFAALLMRWSGQRDVVIGSPVANRDHEAIEGLIGFFVNMLAMRVAAGWNVSFVDLLGEVRETALAAYDHQDLPFELLVEELMKGREGLRDRHPLFQVSFGLHSVPTRELELRGVRSRPLRVGTHGVRLDLELHLWRDPSRSTGSLSGRMVYDADLFDATTLARWTSHFGQLLHAAVAKPERPLAQLDLFSRAQRHQILAEWNDSPVELVVELLHLPFETQAESTPDRTAVVWEDARNVESLSYQALDARAEALARHLRDLGLEPDDRVGVLLDGVGALVVAMLGVLKAGGAYLPLDPTQPSLRRARVLEDSDAKWVVTRKQLNDELTMWPSVIPLETDGRLAHAPGRLGDGPPATTVRGGNIAYVLYTSGSTGRPKGVPISHRAISNHMAWMQSELPLDGNDRVLQKTPVGFDASVWEFWAPLQVGATLVLTRPGDHLDPKILARWLQAHRVTILQVVPTLLRLLLDQARLDRCGSLRRVLCGGEQLSSSLAERFLNTTSRAELHNVYGPTEATIHASTRICSRRVPSERTPIGRPISNARLKVVDPRLRAQPIGGEGELCIAGSGLMRGYLGAPGLSAEKLIPDPWSSTPGGRQYRSGDQVRQLSDGQLEFLGRVDLQVKVRGFRVEPGEIETVLTEHPEIRDAVVVADVAELTAYLVPTTSASALQAAPLRRYLSERLPAQMVPSIFATLDALPLTASGKVDRRALPKLGREGGAVAQRGDARFVQPRSPIEQTLAGIWAEVLKLERVGAYDNFFFLGGHSLLATQVMSRIWRVFKRRLPLRVLFEEPTVARLSKRLETALKSEAGIDRTMPRVKPVARDRELPLSFAQQRLWFLDRLEPESAAYNLPAAMKLCGALDITALRRALCQLAERHEILRTTFPSRAGKPCQRIATEVDLELPTIDLAGLSAGRRQAEARRLASANAERSFDLQRGPLMRGGLVRLAEGEHLLLLCFHHIVTDAWSQAVFLRELSTLYGGSRDSLPELPIQYADYAVSQRRWLTGENLEDLLRYWRRQLANLPGDPLSPDRPRSRKPSDGRLGGAVHTVDLGTETSRALEQLSREAGASRFMVLLTGFAALLGRLTGTTDLVVGTPATGRGSEELEGLIGLFVNTLVLRLDQSGDPTFSGLLERTRDTALDAYAHQDLPFEKLVEELQPERDLSRNPLFQIFFAVGEGSGEAEERHRARQMTLEAWDEHGPGRMIESKFDLALYAGMQGDRTRLSLTFRPELFESTRMLRTLRQLVVLLDGAATESRRPISRLPLLSRAGSHQLTREWSTRSEPVEARWVPSREEGIHHAFEHWAERTPDAVALTFVEPGRGGRERQLGSLFRQVTYGRLNQDADRLAARLRRHGVGPEVPVAICLERSLERVVAVLAVLKAGGAYVPLAPSFPPARLAYMMTDSGARLLLTRTSKRHLFREARESAVEIFFLDNRHDRGRHARSEVSLNAWAEMAPHHPAYAVYTSGSTGRPKGVIGSHRGALAYMRWMIRAYGLSPEDVVPQLAPLSFDMSLRDFFGPLLTGARGVQIEKTILTEPAALLATFVEQRVSFIPGIVPGTWARLLEQGAGDPAKFRSIRLVLTSGDRLPLTDCRRSRNVLDRRARLINQYGTTESYGTASGDVLSSPDDGVGAPLGRPLAHSSTFVLDRYLQPTVTAAVGQLHAASESVVRGYSNLPRLTAEKFVPNPFVPLPGARLYQTGDLVRHRGDGTLDLVGRIDHQLQLRGQRVEPGEIEAVLRRHPAIAEAVVVAREPGSRSDGLILAAYFTVKPKVTPPSASTLREFVAREIPTAMVPAIWKRLDRLPRTHTGKIDRRRLPTPEKRSTGALVLPASPIEEMVARLWEELLGVERVGRDENFFELGGHSLLATQVLARVQSISGVELPLRGLFEGPTVTQLAANVETALASRPASGRPSIPRLPREAGQIFPLSHAQQRLWFLDRLEPASSRYSLPTALELHGDLDVSALAAALAEIVARHEILRTVFPEVDGEGQQLVVRDLEQALPLIDLAGLPADRRPEVALSLARDEALRPFGLAHGPLFRFCLLRRGDDRHVLLLNFHHIVTDGWSQGVFYRELSALYVAAREGRPLALEDLPIQYVDYAAWQRRWLASGVLDDQLDFWRRNLSGLADLRLPVDRPRVAPTAGEAPALPAVRNAAGIQRLVLGPSSVRGLRGLSLEAGASLYMVLLAIFKILLHRRSGQSDVAVGSPIAHRGAEGVEGLIGFFANTLVLRGDFTEDSIVSAVLEEVRETCLAAYAHQDVPFERLVEELRPDREMGRPPLVQVMLVLQNAPFEAPELAGLKLQPLEITTRGARFDLELSFVQSGGSLYGQLRYDRSLFDDTTIRRLLGHFRALVESVTDGHRRVSELETLSAAERHALWVDWNDSPALRVSPRQTSDGGASSLPKLFERQVERTPDVIALSWGDLQISYRRLDASSTRLAQRLRGLGVGSETRVGLDADPSPEFLIGMLAILKAGGTYVPLDLGDPPARLRFMIRDAGLEVLLSPKEPAGMPKAAIGGLPIVDTSPRRSEPVRHQALRDLGPSGSLAYVMYTSGSTGRPKGVGVPHRAVIRLVRGQSFARLDAGQVFFMLAPTSFDASTLEIWGCLLNGGRLVTPESRQSALPNLGRLLERYRISTLWLTAGLFHLLATDQPEVFQSLDQLLAGGDVLSPARIRRVLDGARDVTLVNGYGPTENTTFTCCHRMCRGRQIEAPVPIGRPIAGSRVMVVDRRLRLAATGVEGELVTGGKGLARGYLERPSLTAAAFVPDPFNAHPGERLYLTGDQACRRPDGAVDFRGRRDQQVKIRGFRVEPGEIEDRLRRHSSVRDAAVVMERVAGRRLIACLTPVDDADVPDDQELRTFLAKDLPDPMLPSAYVWVDALPLSRTGKVDRAKLVDLVSSADELQESEHSRAKPRTPLEEQLSKIWSEVLGRQELGVTDSFFNLGGHSLLAVRLVSRIESQLGIRLPLAALFAAPTIRAVARRLEEDRPQAPEILDLSESSPLVEIQAGNGSRQPFFCVHPAGGQVACYVELARCLGPEQPFYGLQASADCSQDIVEMAKTYLAVMRAVRSAAPYYLGGWSTGGVVAFEMAQQLHSQGEEVALLALVDPPTPGVAESPDDAQQLQTFARVLGLPTSASRVAEKLEHLIVDQALQLLHQQLHATQSFASLDFEQLRYLYQVFNNNRQAVSRYRPRAYTGELLLLKPEDTHHKRGTIWTDLASRAEVLKVLGDHYSMVKQPHVRMLARQLRARLSPDSA